MERITKWITKWITRIRYFYVLETCIFFIKIYKNSKKKL